MAIDTTQEIEHVGSDSEESLWNRLKVVGLGKPGNKERVFFTEQLSLLLETGTPLYPALQSLRKQTGHPVMGEIIDGLLELISQGKSLSQGLANYPQVFSSTYVNLVEAAENGGFLDSVLLELMNMDEKREELSSSVRSALSYPIFLMTFSVAVIIFVLVFVFPKFAELFSSIHDELPFTTLVLMSVSDILINHWLLVTLGHLTLISTLIWWLRSPGGTAALDRLKLRGYLLKEIFIQIYLIRSLRVIGLSLANGVSVPDALASCRDVVQNSIFRRFLRSVEDNVREGGGFAVAFQQSDFIPATVKQMITTGEETGSLSKVLGRLADYYERELNKRLSSFTRMIEPIMLIVMGGVVGLIVSSLILPIFKLSRAVG